MFSKEKIKSKLEYLGLDLDKLPKAITEFNPIEFNISRINNDRDKRIYKYIDIDEIEILITPHSANASIQEKYNDAKSLNSFFLEEKINAEKIKEYVNLITLIENLNEKDIEEVEKIQNELKTKPPFFVTYKKSHNWNIYYSEKSKRYFMLVCLNESCFSEFFYLLKMKLALEKARTKKETKRKNKKTKDEFEEFKENEKEKDIKKEYIYAPICYLNYSEKFLSNHSTMEIENYMWFFTKNWPIVYELYDKKNVYTYNIIGQISILDKIKSEYKIILKDKEEADKFYKFLKAIYILESKTDGYINFEAKLDKINSLEFYVDDEIIFYEELPKLLTTKYKNLLNEIKLYKEETLTRTNKLEILRESIKEKELNYQYLQSEITKYLNSRRTFFGKFKYFFGMKVKDFDKEQEKIYSKKKNLKNDNEEKNKKENEIENKLKKLGLEELGYIIQNAELNINKANITIEDFVKLYDSHKYIYDKVKNITLDINAAKLFEINIDKKIENAKMYINEIDSSRRNIFEFWRFTNKDNLKELEEPDKTKLPNEEEEKIENNIDVKRDKIFDYDMDYTKFAQEIDKFQREKFTIEEIESIFLSSTKILDIVNNMKTKDIVEQDIINLKNELLEEKAKEKNQGTEYDIFGNLDANLSVDYFGDKSFREKKRNKLNILKYYETIENVELLEKIHNINESIQRALNKTSTKYIFECYKVLPILGSQNEKGYDIYDLNPDKELKSYIYDKEDKIQLIKVKVPTMSKAIFYTNIMYYLNQNNTLPLGMDVSSKLLLDGEQFNWIENKKTKYNINNIDKKTNKIINKQIYLTEYIIVPKDIINI